MQNRRLFWLLYVLAILLATYLYLTANQGFALQRFRAIGVNTTVLGPAEYFRRFVYVVNYMSALGFVCLLPFWRSRWAVGVTSFLFVATCVLESGYAALYGRPPSFTDIFTLNANIFDAKEASREFGHLALPGLWRALLIVGPLLALRFLTGPRPLVRWGASACFGYLAFAYTFILYQRGEPAVIGFPMGYSYVLGSTLMVPATRATAADLAPTPFSALTPFTKVVMLIDESVAWPTFDDRALRGDRFISFGEALSGANCSAASNFYLRRGTLLSRGYVPVTSILKIAKNAGYKTAYLNNQDVLKDVSTRDYFSNEEIALMDEIVPVPKLPQYEIDHASLATLKRLLDEPGKTFILMNKVGAHFPYNENLPEADRTGDRVENYRRAVRRAGVDFLNEFSKLLPPNAIAFYTSDHGQRPEGPVTHCGSFDTAEFREWQVPFVVMAGDPSWVSRLQAVKKTTNRRLTHFELTESVRNAMGFEFAEVGSVFKKNAAKAAHNVCLIYGPPLGFFGRQPTCKNF